MQRNLEVKRRTLFAKPKNTCKKQKCIWKVAKLHVNLSDFEIRKLEEKEDRVSAIISHYEKMRLEEDRSKLNSQSLKKSVCDIGKKYQSTFVYI